MLRAGVSIVIAVIALLAVQPLLPSLQLIKQAYAHGLHSDTVMVANLNGRALTARIDMYDKNLMPLSSIDTNHIPDEAKIMIRIYDANTDKNIHNVSLLLRINYAGKMLVLDNFFTPDGEIWLSIKPDATLQEVIINAPQETTGLPKYIGTLNNPAQLKGPLLVDGGLYEIKGEIWSIDSPQVLLDPTLKFTSYVTVATVQPFNIGNGNVEVRSFYDKIIKFDYMQDKNAIVYSMPFNWDKKYVEQVPLLHMETVIDAPSLIADTYTATVNGIRLPNTAVITDKYSLAGKPIVHIMLPTSMLINISDQLNSIGMGNSKVADFMIIPGEKDIGIPLKGGNISTLSATTSSMKYNINLTLPSNDIMQGQPIQFGIMIMDATTLAMKDTKYKFVVLKDGQELIRRDGIAVGGSGNESVTFPTNVVGPVTIRLENIGDSNESAEFTINVVPEFPLLVILPMVLAFAGMIALFRFKGKDWLHAYRVQ
jgi:hypothetical protein